MPLSAIDRIEIIRTRYADPAAEEHLQTSIPQDGRTVLARMRVGF